MIKFEHTDIFGWEAAIRGMRNPKNSWDKSDSYKTHVEDEHTLETADFEFFIGDNDLKLMKSLASGGPVHAKYRRMINVTVDITAPLYWWKEFDTYKVGTVANSCSTMHKIHDKEFTINDFSHEHLAYITNFEELNMKPPIIDVTLFKDGTYTYGPRGVFEIIVEMLNKCRDLYLETNDKTYWWQLIQLLPSSYNQKRTIQLSYEVLAGIYPMRKDHKLDEWHKFCDWIKSLPHSELITGSEGDEK